MSKPDSKVKEELARLVTRGAVLTLMFQNPLDLLVGDIFFCGGDMVLYSEIFLEDQHHVHVFKLLGIKKYHDDGFRLTIQTDEEILTAYLFAIEKYERQQMRSFRAWEKYKRKYSRDLHRFYGQMLSHFRLELIMGTLAGN